VYSPNVLFFRHSEEIPEENGGAYSPHVPISLNCVAVAAYQWPPTTEVEGEIRLEEKYEEGTREKIISLLSIAALTNHKYLVLSALGCGAFHNPPLHIAQIFRDVLSMPMFQNRFERVIFAIYTKGAAANVANYNAFVEVFGSKKFEEN
jgi:uncharacterized protein (TIGR02452 family)